MKRCSQSRTSTAILAFLLAVSMNALLPGDGLAHRHARGTTRTSVNHNRHYNANRNVYRDVNINRNVRVDRNIHVNRGYRDVDIDVYEHHHHHHHPVATAMAITAAATATAAGVGSVVRSLPPSCSMVVVGNVAYQQCGSTWYAPQYVGTQVQYVVINAPY